MDTLYSTIALIEKSLLFLYLIIFAIAIYRFRIINSTVICTGLLFIMETVMNWIRSPLLELGSKEAWYGTWVFLYVLTIIVLYKTHHTLKINLSRMANIIAYTQLVSAGIHTIRYLEREHFGGEYLDAWYYLAVNSVNISLMLFVMFTVIKDKKEKLVGLYV